MATSNLFCGICFEYYKSGDDIICSTCGHVFHNNCFKNWLTRSSTCPDCCVTSPQTHPIFLHIDDPSLAKKKLLQQLEESEQNFLHLHGVLAATESKCTELSNEVQLQKAQIQSYEQELTEIKQTKANNSTQCATLEKDLEIARLASLNNVLEKKLMDFNMHLTSFLNERDTDNNNVAVDENKENINENNLAKLKQLLNGLEIDVQNGNVNKNDVK